MTITKLHWRLFCFAKLSTDYSSDVLSGAELYMLKDFDNPRRCEQDLFERCSQLKEACRCNNEKIEHTPR